MEFEEIREKLDTAIQKLLYDDQYLLENDLSERCIASRLALYLQHEFKSLYFVDVEYNRNGVYSKALSRPACGERKEDTNGRVYPDIIVHKRGAIGPNLLVLELKKTSHEDCQDGCDKDRIKAFKQQLNYKCGATLLLHVSLKEPEVDVEWIEPSNKYKLTNPKGHLDSERKKRE